MNSHLTVFKLALVSFLPGVWVVPVPPATAQDETLTGWFSFIVADSWTETGQTSETTYIPTEVRPRAAKSAKTSGWAIRRLWHTASAVASTKEVPVQEP